MDQYARDAEALEAELEAMTKAVDPVEQWEQKAATVERDLDKLAKYNSAITTASESHVKTMAELKQAREDHLKQQDALKADVERTKRLIAAQGMSPQEIQAMTTDRTNLTASLAAAKSKLSQRNEESLALEMSLTKAMNKAAQTCALYETVATRVGILPAAPEGYEDVDFVQEINGAAENPAPDCQSRLRPALVELRQKERAAYHALLSADADLENRITKLDEDCQEAEDQKADVDSKLDLVEQEHSNRKEVRMPLPYPAALPSSELTPDPFPLCRRPTTSS